MIGLEGIVIQETQNTFRIVSTDDRVKSKWYCCVAVSNGILLLLAIPKGRTVFTFTVMGHKFTLYGQNMLFRAGDRSARKFKDKPFVDL